MDETYRNGARVFVERGNTTTHVSHDKGASNWTFVAGPFAPKAIADDVAALKKRIQPVLDEEKAAGRVSASGP